MRMARVNVYLPDSLAEAARAAELNVSKLTQEAVKRAISARDADEWLSSVAELGSTGVGHEDALKAVAEARSELGRVDD